MPATKTQNGSAPKTLAEALVAIQAEAPKIPLDSTNPHFKSKFASLAGVMERVLPVTTKYGIAITHMPTTQDGEPALTTELLHVSGESKESTMKLYPSKLDPQGQGSALTYGRRYMVLAMLGLVGDEDDDANAASQPNGQRAAPQQKAQGTIPENRINEIGKGIRATGISLDRIQLLFGSVGADSPETDSSADLKAALTALTTAQADKLQTALEAEADRGGES